MTNKNASENTSPPPETLLFDLIEHFCLHLKLSAGQSSSAANTAETYSNAMQVFKKFIKRAYSRKRQVKAPYPITILDDDVLLAYYDWLSKTPPEKKTDSTAILSEEKSLDKASSSRYAPSTIQHYLAATKRFLTWAVAQNYLPQFDLAKSTVRLKDGRAGGGKAYPHRKVDPNLAAILLYYDNLPLPGEDTSQTDQERSNLSNWQMRRKRIALLRNRAIVYVLFDTGLRVSELTSLTRDEVDRALKSTPIPEDIAIEVIGKGGRRRTIWITYDSLIRLKAYLQERDDPSNVLFVGSKKGVPITRQMVWKIVKDGAKGAGVGDFTGPHAFRHWLARQLFNDEENPVPIEDVQALLGHASPTTTRTIYAPHTSKSRLHKTIKKARKAPKDTINRTEVDGDDF